MHQLDGVQLIEDVSLAILMHAHDLFQMYLSIGMKSDLLICQSDIKKKYVQESEFVIRVTIYSYTKVCAWSPTLGEIVNFAGRY